MLTKNHFTYNSYAKEQIWKFTGEKPYQCSKCEKDFSKNASFKII